MHTNEILAFLGDEYFAEKSTDECIPLILKRENSTIYIYIYIVIEEQINELRYELAKATKEKDA